MTDDLPSIDPAGPGAPPGSSAERWKDRVEVSLDGRQIFFLFFGSAVAACLIFVAGVLVGRRIEQRSLAAAPPVAENPLDGLDRMDPSEEDDDGLTFREALVREQQRRRDEGARAAEPARPSPPPAEAARPAAPVALPKLPASELAREGREAREGKTGRFALQVASLSDHAAADAFAQKIRGAGYHPSVVATQVPGKGTVYRVRVGDYATRQAADAAVADYNKKQPGFAFVVSQ